METGRASKTALRVALRRAVHQVLDQPHVLHDPIAVPLLGPQFAFDPPPREAPVSRAPFAPSWPRAAAMLKTGWPNP